MLTIIALICVASVSAHNWVNSPSRSENANPIKPSMPSETGQPHLQVVAGQRFQIEWVTGHDSYVYWILLNAKDKAYLLQQNDKVLEDYINNAPMDQQKPPAPEWAKMHRKYNDPSLDNKKGSGDGMFSKCHAPGTPMHIERPDVFEGSFSGSPGTRSSRFDKSLIVNCEYVANECTAGDRRIVYKNPKYPYILAVHRYKICSGNGSRPDVAWFAIPEGSPPGNYYAQYNWRGYYDIVDVQVLPGTTPLAKTYGDKPEPLPKGTPAEYKRIDHCVFPDATTSKGAEPINVCVRMRSQDSINSCKKMCDYTTIIGCSGINVIPINNPKSVYKHFQNVSFVPYEYSTVCKESTLKSKANEDDRICYPVLAREPTETSGKYVVSDDPEDPIFYSTCYVRIRRVVLANAPDTPPPTAEETAASEPEFMFQQHCVDCRTSQLSKLEEYTPAFEVQDQCIHCDLDAPKLKDLSNLPRNNSAPYPFKEEKEKVVCDNNSDPEKPIRETFTCTDNPRQSCNLRLNYPGTSSRADVSDRDCVEMIMADDRCDKTVMYRHKKTDFWNIECNCWRKDLTCCGPCIEVKENNFFLYKL